MSDASNRLPVLAAEIRRAHADVLDAVKTASERAIEAGHALIEAKELVQHGEWLPWLRENCALAERTAQLYMKVAKSGLESATVAVLGLQGAAKSIVGYIDYWSELDDAALREWRIFTLFLAREGHYVEGAICHTEWLRRGNVATPSEWLFGENGNRFRRTWGKELSAGQLEAWRKFLEEHQSLAVGELDAELDRLAGEQGEMPVPSRRRRRRAPR